MKKNSKSKQYRKPLRHKLSKEQKEKRKSRFVKLTKVMLWLNPATQPIMIARLAANKAKERKAKMQKENRAVNPQVEAIINKLNFDIANAGTMQGKIVAANAGKIVASNAGKIVAANAGKLVFPIGGAVQGKIVTANTGKLELSPKGEAVSPIDGAANQEPLPDVTIEQIAEQAASNPTAAVNDPAGENVLSDIGDELSAEGGVAGAVFNYDKIFANAKASANALTDVNARKEALAFINDIETSIRSQINDAKEQVVKADLMDVSQAKAELAKVNPVAVVDSLESPNVESVEKPDAEEKKAIELPPASQLAKEDSGNGGGVPAWVWYLGGVIFVGAIGYGIYKSKSQQA